MAARSAGKFRRDRRHRDRSAPCPEQGVDLGGVGVAQLLDGVGAAARVAEPRPLEVDARDHAVVDEVGEHAHRAPQVVRRRGDQARQRRGRAVPQVESRRGGGTLGVRVGVGVTAPAVAVHVDEAGDEHGVGQVEIGRAGRYSGAAVDDAVAGRLDPAWTVRAGACDDRARRDHRAPRTRSAHSAHSVSVTLRSPRGQSGSPPRAIARCSASCCSGRISSIGERLSGTLGRQRDGVESTVVERRCGGADAEHVGVLLAQAVEHRHHRPAADGVGRDRDHRHVSGRSSQVARAAGPRRRTPAPKDRTSPSVSAPPRGRWDSCSRARW